MGAIDFQPELKAVLREASSEDGDARAQALEDLKIAEHIGLIQLERHRRDPEIILKVRIPLQNELLFFAKIDQQSPTALRQLVADQFRTVRNASVPRDWQSQWQLFCDLMVDKSLNGSDINPFDRNDTSANAELLTVLPRLLAWEGESLVRFVSCVLCNDSKRLEELATVEKEGENDGKLRGRLGRALEMITEGKIRSLEDLGILRNPRFVLVAGPLRVSFGGKLLDLGLLNGAFRLAAQDLERASDVQTSSCKCVTVENETSFHELAKLKCGDLFVHTSYPSVATIKLINRLPETMDFWHFGDSDEYGFEILRVLREKTRRDFRPLHMQRGKMPFEQESLGRPNLSEWPYYRT